VWKLRKKCGGPYGTRTGALPLRMHAISAANQNKEDPCNT